MKVLVIAGALAVCVYAQDIVEHSLATAGSATGAAAGRNAGQGIGAVFGHAGQALKRAGEPESGGARASVSAVPATRTRKSRRGKQAPAVRLAIVEPGDVKVGMSREELTQKFGKPAMQTSNAQGTEAGETWWYRAAGKGQFAVMLREGKVASVSADAGSKRDASGLMFSN